MKKICKAQVQLFGISHEDGYIAACVTSAAGGPLFKQREVLEDTVLSNSKMLSQAENALENAQMVGMIFVKNPIE